VGPATGAGQCREVAPRLILGGEQQHGGGIGEDQRITELEGGQRAWPLPVQTQHPGADRPDLQSRAGAREQGQDAADGRSLAGGFGQREVRLELVAVAAAVFLLRHVAGSVRPVTTP
jgi:hypothetical protein